MRRGTVVALLTLGALAGCTDDVAAPPPTTLAGPTTTIPIPGPHPPAIPLPRSLITVPTSTEPVETDVVEGGPPEVLADLRPASDWSFVGPPARPAAGWEQLPDPHIVARTNPFLVWSDDQLIVFGGNRARAPEVQSGRWPLTDGAIFSDFTRTWTPIPAMPVPQSELSGLLTPIVWRGELYVVNGLALYRYPLTGGEWTMVARLGEDDDLYTIADVVVGNHLIVYDLNGNPEGLSLGNRLVDLTTGQVDDLRIPEYGLRTLVDVSGELFALERLHAFGDEDPVDPMKVSVAHRLPGGDWEVLDRVALSTYGPWFAHGTTVVAVGDGFDTGLDGVHPRGALYDTESGDWYLLPRVDAQNGSTGSAAVFDSVAGAYDGFSTYALDVEGWAWVRIPDLPHGLDNVVGGTLGPDFVAVGTVGDVTPEIRNAVYVWRTHT